jgi:hypothetical protein
MECRMRAKAEWEGLEKCQERDIQYRFRKSFILRVDFFSRWPKRARRLSQPSLISIAAHPRKKQVVESPLPPPALDRGSFRFGLSEHCLGLPPVQSLEQKLLPPLTDIRFRLRNP